MPAAFVEFRFYAELNAFLMPRHRQRAFDAACARDASAKHMIEALGVPHTEVELILANGEPVDFSYRLRAGDRISVFPHFSTFPIRHPLREIAPRGAGQAAHCRFIADAHLGRLARDLRMLGFDVLYRNDFADAEVAAIAAAERRIVLTRDRDLLIRKTIVYGCYLHATTTREQILEVMRRYRLAAAARPLSRCLNCNGLLTAVTKGDIAHRVPPRSMAGCAQFYACTGCEQVYWDGSHTTRMRERVHGLLDSAYTREKAITP